MKRTRQIVLLAAAIAAAVSAAGPAATGQAAAGAAADPHTAQAAQAAAPPPRVVELRAPDGTRLAATYFAAARPGPGALLFHQTNRTRKAWDGVAAQLAAAGVHTLTLDMRGFGDSGGTPFAELDRQNAPNAQIRGQWPGDIEVAWQYLAAQPGVDRDVIGLGGAGVDGAINAVETARLHPSQVKSLALLSGETLPPGGRFLRQATELPELFVVADDDEYPPIPAAMEVLYVTAASEGKRLVRFPAAAEAPWLWYEPFDVGRVPATGKHGTDLFGTHPELPGIVVGWFAATLLKTPGHAPPDTVAAAPILSRLEANGGVAQVTQQLAAARRRDPRAQLWPEIAVDILAEGHLRAGETQAALALFALNLVAYPDSADAHDGLAGAYLAAGRRDLARQHAERALALLDSHAAPASSWSDTEPRRGEIRRSATRTLEKLKQGAEKAD